MDPLSKEFFKLSLKESAYKIITEGSENEIEELNSIIEKDPDRFFIKIKENNSLFNLPLSNGKTLIYIACQEGKDEIVKFLLQKELNPLIKSKVDTNKFENCLDVAVRWNYKKIVGLLLLSKNFEAKEIKEILSRRNIDKDILSMLRDYLKLIKSNNSCKCF